MKAEMAKGNTNCSGIVSLEFTLKCFNRILATHLEFWFLLSNTLGQVQSLIQEQAAHLCLELLPAQC
ncbi:hypothetical protein RJT34_19230 [Clitoria ternatea]|uniref:Uncharacterized protein n=1 Tax=Clitoria ternatea TaxID=43366 RepID=A0AAN9IR38_CLITE